MLIAAGCQSGGSAGTSQTAQATRTTITETELRAYCPPIALRAGTSFFSQYERGGDGDPAKLIHQASLSDVTRACTFENGNMIINAAVAGRVVPGPLGKTGNVTMPIRIVVVSGEGVLYSQLHDFTTNIASTSEATQFTFSDPAITIPQPAQRNVRIFAGFDEGPAS